MSISLKFFSQKKTKKPFGVNLILLHPEINQLINCCIDNKVEIVVFVGVSKKKVKLKY